MPSNPSADTSVPEFPQSRALFSEAGRGALRAAVERRLALTEGVWKMRLLARDLVSVLGAAVEKALLDGGVSARLRRVPALRITRGVREHGSCSISRARDGECRLAFSGHLFFPGNGAALIDVVAHELLHACLPAREGHGELFRRGMTLVNDALGLHIETHAEKSSIRQSEALYRYKVVCAGCGAVSYYLRAGGVVRRPSRYRCAKCGKGGLEVYQLIQGKKDEKESPVFQ